MQLGARFDGQSRRFPSGSFSTFASLSARSEANVGNIRTTRDIIVSSGFYNFDIRTRDCRKRDSNVKINPLDMMHDGSWVGIATGDRVEASYEPCPCGRSTIHLHATIQRFSEINCGDDKITCAATPAAQADALGYLNTL